MDSSYDIIGNYIDSFQDTLRTDHFKLTFGNASASTKSSYIDDFQDDLLNGTIDVPYQEIMQNNIFSHVDNSLSKIKG